MKAQRLVSKPGFWLNWRWGGGNKLTLGKKVCFQRKKQTFWEGGQTLVSGCQNKGFDPEKGLFPKPKTKVCGGDCGTIGKLKFHN